MGKVLSAVIALEIEDVHRFGDAKYLVSYAGLVPTARESAERKRQGRCPRDCNVYLKWAFVEAANLIASKQKAWSGRHAVRLYQRVKHNTKMHGKATMAVARHLAEASYWTPDQARGVSRAEVKGGKFFVDARVSANSTHGLRGRVVNAKPSGGIKDHADGKGACMDLTKEQQPIIFDERLDFGLTIARKGRNKV